MIALQWMSVSMILIVLSLVQINASKYRSVRQVTTNGCPAPDVVFCDFVKCDNGRCVENKTSSDCFNCQCDAGFTGKLCDTNIVTQSGCNPGCQNGGQCQLTATNTFVCVCPPQYTGNQCQTSILATHPCVTMPATVCQNGGICTVNGAGFLCNCTTGWSGTNCQTQQTITQCTPNTCGAHGTCIQAIAPSGPIVICDCENRWTGKFCEINLDVNCPIGYCLSGGTCKVDGNIPMCLCPPTHSGPRCETLIGTLITTTTQVSAINTTTGSSTLSPIPGNCASNPCLNRGSCFNTGNSFICVCSGQWSGPTCGILNSMTTTAVPTPPSINPCSLSPCSNGGSCYRNGNGYVCVCTSPFTGPTCALAKSTTVPTVTVPNPSITCANQPCQNGGTCYNSGSSYFCYCGSGSNYTGKNCEIPTGTLTADCPLNCSPGYCVRAGGSQSAAHACMCNGILTPTRCTTK